MKFTVVEEPESDPFAKPPIPLYVGRTDDLGPPECELGNELDFWGFRDELFEKEYAARTQMIKDAIEIGSDPLTAKNFQAVVRNLLEMPSGSYVHSGYYEIKKISEACWRVGTKIFKDVSEAAIYLLTPHKSDTKDEVFESLATGIAAIASLEEGDDEPCNADFFEDWLINPAPETIDTFPKKMKWLARLTAASRQWEAELKQIDEKIAALEPYVLEEFALNGIERQTVGGFTFYPQTEMWVNKKAEKDGVTMEMVCDALKNTGLGYMVSDGYSASSLKSKVKEMKEAGIDIPDELKAVLNIGEKIKLIARKA